MAGCEPQRGFGTGELHSLPSLGLEAIYLDYQTANRTDVYGNVFRFRAKVKGLSDSDVGHWAWDVFLKVTKSNKLIGAELEDILI